MNRLTLIIWAALLSASSVTHSTWSSYGSTRDLFSFEIPSAWQVQGERSLENTGYLDGPPPVYALIAGAEPAQLSGVANPPTDYAFSETPGPWFMALIQTGTTATPSSGGAYQLAPDFEVALQESEGLDPSVISLTRPVDVRSGRVRGSQDRSEVIVTGAGDIEMDEVVYAQGHTIWMTMAGCTVACYNANAATLSRVISSVKVGTAAL